MADETKAPVAEKTAAETPAASASAPSSSGPSSGGSSSGGSSSGKPRAAPFRSTRFPRLARSASRWSGRRPRRWPQIFPPQEGLQILRRKDRVHQLQGRSPARRLRRRERQDRSPAPDRRVHAAPAPSVVGHQAGAQHRPAAVRRPLELKASSRRLRRCHRLFLWDFSLRFDLR